MKGDIRKSKKWFEKAIKSGDGSAALQLAKLYMVSDKEKDTVKFYLKHAINNENMCEADIEEAEKLLSEM
jgi:TPR repeat protein